MNPDDLGKAVAAMRAQGADDETVHRFLTEHMGLQEVGGNPVDPMAATHRAYQTGRLQQNNKDLAEAEHVGPAQYMEAASQAPETFAAGVPGVKLGLSKVRAKMQGRPMAEVQKEVNDETSDVPYASAAGRVLGGMALTPVLPASGMAAGAIIGGADQALNNDPSSTMKGRVGRAVLGAGLGGVAGEAGDRLVTGARALAPRMLGGAGNAAETRAGMLADQAASARKLFTKALAEGQGKAAPPEVTSFMQSDDIAPIVAELKSTRPFANVAEDSPEMLDAVYKNLSDRAGIIKSKLGALIPRNANLGRVAQVDNAMARGEAVDAATQSGFMPSYGDAVKDFATRQRGIDAFDTGYDALRSTLSPSQVAAKNLNRPNKTPEGFTEWVQKPGTTEAEIQDAIKGILGLSRSAPKGKMGGSLGKASAMLRPADAGAGNTLPNLTQKALLALANSLAPQ